LKVFGVSLQYGDKLRMPLLPVQFYALNCLPRDVCSCTSKIKI